MFYTFWSVYLINNDIVCMSCVSQIALMTYHLLHSQTVTGNCIS